MTSELAPRPTSLCAALLALNALARPYDGLTHDARLYALQVLNRAQSDRYAGDLFLRFGSQDDYSIFSRILAPLTTLLGVERAFFWLYLVANVLLVCGLVRVVRAVVPGGVAPAAALAYMMVTPLPFAGYETFHVHEPFLTARLPAVAAVLLGLDQLIRARVAVALILLGAAALLHPLMAAGGLALWLGCLITSVRITWSRVIVALGAGAMAVIVVVSPTLGHQIFGTVDAEWLGIVRATSPYLSPMDWRARDWIDSVVALAVPLWAAAVLRLREPRLARILLVVTAACAIGLISSIGALWGMHSLLVKVQPYRVIWIAKVLQVPLALWLAERAWRASSHRESILAVLVIGYFAVPDLMALALLPVLAVAPAVVALTRGLKREPIREDWVVHSLIRSLALGLVLGAALKVAIFVTLTDLLLRRLDPVRVAWVGLAQLGPLLMLPTAVAVLVVVARYIGLGRRFACVAFGLALLVQLTILAVRDNPRFREAYAPHGGDVDFVRSFLHQRGTPSGAPASLYAAGWPVEMIWVDLDSTSYFHWAQVAGVMFSRETAMEAQRRGLLVRPFEIQRLQESTHTLPEALRFGIPRFFRTTMTEPAPTKADMLRLCGDETLAVVVLDYGFPGLHSATNGHVYIYDCRTLREFGRAAHAGRGAAS